MHKLDKLQAVATMAARRAGEHVLANLHRRNETNLLNRSDVKHQLDLEAEAVATQIISSTYPEHHILAEESGEHSIGKAHYRWIIDPIDGTINFFHGLPLWCCSIAVQYQEKTVAAAVFVPELQQMYEATSESPALCNGSEIQVSQNPIMEHAMIATGADKWNKDEPPFRFLCKIAEMAQRPRILGAAALDMCLVASGRLDGYFESGIYLWDVAAASLIVERAGGRCELLRTWPGHRVACLATNGILHKQCCAQLEPMLGV